MYSRGEVLESDVGKLAKYPEPVFDAQRVYEVFNEILTNELYTKNMQKQQKLSK